MKELKKTIPISKPIVGKKEIVGVEKVLRSGKLVQGKYVEAFERNFSEYMGTQYALALNNGTSSLICALLANDIGDGDEVITTPFSFISTVSSILFCGAKPVFVDIKEDFNIDVNLIVERITKKTKAIMPVHLFGNPCNMKVIGELCEDYDLALIEDACQAHGARFEEKKVGSFGTGCFSFYATKNMTTAEGGMITTNKKNIFETIKLLRNIGMKTHYDYKLLGFNFRMTEMQAAMGRIQLQRLPIFIKKRIRNAIYLTRKLIRIEGVKPPQIAEGHVFNQYTIIVEEDSRESRDELQRRLEKKGIQTRIYYPCPLHKISFIESRETLPCAERMSKMVLSLPVHPSLTLKELEYIATCIGGSND